MWTTYEHWQSSQLQRLANLDRNRVEELFNHLFYLQPTLLLDLAISAVDQEELSIPQCSALTGLSEEQVEQQLGAWRGRSHANDVEIQLDNRGVARVADGQVCVWEVVHSFRRLGSIGALSDAFPSLTVHELMAALAYAERHQSEVEALIERYEEVRTRRQSEYPFVR